ncbi:hypothetical protein HY522_03470 [bacterium]|nr:hypothetical protein [bacterium]
MGSRSIALAGLAAYFIFTCLMMPLHHHAIAGTSPSFGVHPLAPAIFAPGLNHQCLLCQLARSGVDSIPASASSLSLSLDGRPASPSADVFCRAPGRHSSGPIRAPPLSFHV